MPYTVALSFDNFYQNINLSGDHREIANRRKDDIVLKLKNNFDVIEAFASGSIPKYTALKERADLDVIIALRYSKHIKDKKPSEVLQDVRDVLASKTNVRKNGQAVTLYYKTWPHVDIVPCRRIEDNDGTYLIPDMNTEKWITSKPKIHTANMKERAGTCGSNFRKVITMVKHWNSKHGSYLQSYHIEVLAMNIFTSSMDDITWDIFQFFEKSIDLVSSSLWYEGSLVNDYLTWDNHQETQKRLEIARDKSRDAWYKTYGDNSDHKNAIFIWQQIFRDKFPAYG